MVHQKRGHANRNYDVRTVMKAMRTERKDTEWSPGGGELWEYFHSGGFSSVSPWHPAMVNFMPP